MREEPRRSVLRSIGAASVGFLDWFGFGSDSSSETENPEQQIQNYPLQHGTDVDAPGGAHHARPGAGAFLAEASGAFDLDIKRDEFSWTLTAASSGKHSVSFPDAYDIALPTVRLPVSGSAVSDLSAIPASWSTTSDGSYGGLTVAWNNGTTADETGVIEIVGFQK